MGQQTVQVQRLGAGAQGVDLSRQRRDIGTLLELVIGFEGMRLHRRIACLHMRWQHDANRRRLTALLALARQGEAHGVGMRHAALQRLKDGGL